MPTVFFPVYLNEDNEEITAHLHNVHIPESHRICDVQSDVTAFEFVK